MALAFSQVLRGKIDQQNVTITNITLDDTYIEDGWPIAANDLGLSTASAVIPLGNPGGATYAWDPAASKMLVYWADYDAGADGLLVELTDVDILDTVVLPVLAIGI